MKKKYFLSLLVFGVASLAVAIASPVAMLESASQRILHSLQANRAEIKRNPQLANSIVRRIVLPHIDVNIMARSVLGRNIWRKTSGQQRKQFIREFTNLVINTYASAFLIYTDEKIKFYPVRGGYQNKSYLQVKSVIMQKGGPPISVNYSVVAVRGRWKVYDFNVNGVSLVRSYRAQFAREVTVGGMPKLLQTLVKHNRRQRS